MTSAFASACSASAVSSPGSPGPAPTSHTEPGTKSGRSSVGDTRRGMAEQTVVPPCALVYHRRKSRGRRMVSRGAWFLAAVLGGAARAQADMNDLLILPRAAERNDFDAVLNMLQRGDTTDTEGEDRRAALSFAAANGNMQIMNLLLDHLADVEHRDRFGDTALHWAALNGQTEAVKRLLAANAGINDQNGQGVTAL